MDYLVKPVEVDQNYWRVYVAFSDVCRQAFELVAEDPQTQALVGLARKVAAVDISVLLSGPQRQR